MQNLLCDPLFRLVVDDFVGSHQNKGARYISIQRIYEVYGMHYHKPSERSTYVQPNPQEWVTCRVMAAVVARGDFSGGENHGECGRGRDEKVDALWELHKKERGQIMPASVLAMFPKGIPAIFEVHQHTLARRRLHSANQQCVKERGEGGKNFDSEKMTQEEQGGNTRPLTFADRGDGLRGETVRCDTLTIANLRTQAASIWRNRCMGKGVGVEMMEMPTGGTQGPSMSRAFPTAKR